MRKLLLLLVVFSFIAVVPKAASAFTIWIPQFTCEFDPALVGAEVAYNDTAILGITSDVLTLDSRVVIEGPSGAIELMLPECMRDDLMSAIQVNKDLNGNKKALNIKVIDYDGVPTLVGVTAGKAIPQF